MNRKEQKEYRIWRAMKARCYAPSNKDKPYQKRGIKVCDRWLHSYENFFADMGPIPGDEYSIERLDFNGDYCPENCIWLPQNEQSRNRSMNKIFEYQGQKHFLKDWARIFGIKYTTLYQRIYRQHMSFEDAVTKPLENLIEIDGEKRTTAEWCRILNLNESVIFSRVNRGMSNYDALTKHIDRVGPYKEVRKHEETRRI